MIGPSLWMGGPTVLLVGDPKNVINGVPLSIFLGLIFHPLELILPRLLMCLPLLACHPASVTSPVSLTDVMFFEMPGSPVSLWAP